jgi:GNAT superfamily N-acetyltransferase
MNIRQIQTQKDLRTFVELPYRLYRKDPVWVPPLRSEQHSQFDPQKNPFLKHCDRALFLLEEDGRVVGRIAAFIDHLAVEAWQEPIGLFGYYECMCKNSAEDAGASLLLGAARDWLRQRGMKIMRGPWSFVSQEWGMVIEGFTPSPVIMAPYNPPYYNDHLASFGLEKVKDLLCYYISAAEGYQIPERILTLTGAVAKRYGVRVRPINMKIYDQEVRTVIDLSNRSIIDNWGYSPVTEEEVQAMARDLKAIIRPQGVLFAENAQGEPIGFAIALPDINVLLKGLDGRLFPFGWIKLLVGLPRLQHYRMFALGVTPEYHGKGIDSLIYRYLYESLSTPEVWVEINYVLEDNVPMNNAILKLNAKPLRRYRIYQMNI